MLEISSDERDQVRRNLKELGLTKDFKFCVNHADKFFSLHTIRLTRKLISFEKATDFYDLLYTELNSEFPRPTLTWSIEDKEINIKCKYKGCPLKLAYRFEVNK